MIVHHVEAVRAFQRTNILGYVTFGVAFTLALHLAEAYATSRVYWATVAEVSTAEIFVVRGASYLPWILYIASSSVKQPIELGHAIAFLASSKPTS